MIALVHNIWCLINLTLVMYLQNNVDIVYILLFYRCCESRAGSQSYRTATPSSGRCQQQSDKRNPERPSSAPGFRFCPSPQAISPRPSTAHSFRNLQLTSRPDTPMTTRSPNMTSRSLNMTSRSSTKLRPFFAGKYIHFIN